MTIRDVNHSTRKTLGSSRTFVQRRGFSMWKNLKVYLDLLFRVKYPKGTLGKEVRPAVMFYVL